MKIDVKKIKAQFKKFMRQGMSPGKLAFTFAIGLALGIFPVLGTSTGLCIVAALAFRLNQAALQLVNYLAYPLQIICIIPFYKLGAMLFHDTEFTLSFTELKLRLQNDLYATLLELWDATCHALLAWALVAPVLVFAVYSIALPVLKRIEARTAKQQPRQ